MKKLKLKSPTLSSPSTSPTPTLILKSRTSTHSQPPSGSQDRQARPLVGSKEMSSLPRSVTNGQLRITTTSSRWMSLSKLVPASSQTGLVSLARNPNRTLKATMSNHSQQSSQRPTDRSTPSLLAGKIWQLTSPLAPRTPSSSKLNPKISPRRPTITPVVPPPTRLTSPPGPLSPRPKVLSSLTLLSPPRPLSSETSQKARSPFLKLILPPSPQLSDLLAQTTAPTPAALHRTSLTSKSSSAMAHLFCPLRSTLMTPTPTAR